MSNQRKHERIDFIQATYCKITGDKPSQNLNECHISNISKGGMLIDIPDFGVNVDDQILIIYHLKNHLRKDKVIVKHIKKFVDLKCGCEFADKDPNRDALIMNMLNNS